MPNKNLATGVDTPPELPTAPQLLQMLITALEEAQGKTEETLRPTCLDLTPKVEINKHSERQALHAARSAAFVELLARQIEKYYERHQDVCIFRKTKSSERFRRGSATRKEFLFDILACIMGSYQPPINQSAGDIDYIKQSLLQIESELANNTAETLVDASKLVCGAAPLSLFIGPLSLGEEPGHPYRQVLSQVAPHIHGQFLCAFVPHPRHWETSRALPVSLFLWARDKRNWERVLPQ